MSHPSARVLALTAVFLAVPACCPQTAHAPAATQRVESIRPPVVEQTSPTPNGSLFERCIAGPAPTRDGLRALPLAEQQLRDIESAVLALATPVTADSQRAIVEQELAGGKAYFGAHHFAQAARWLRYVAVGPEQSPAMQAAQLYLESMNALMWGDASRPRLECLDAMVEDLPLLRERRCGKPSASDPGCAILEGIECDLFEAEIRNRAPMLYARWCDRWVPVRVTLPDGRLCLLHACDL
jgi:hypothetical protein